MSTEMPKGLLAGARWAAENTPETRNRAVDLYRAIAILFVVLGHWLLVAPVIRDGELELSILLAEQTWTQYATWLFQVMPIFFFVGGYSNGLSWASARKDPERARIWASGRLTRLLKPTVPLVLFWALAAGIARSMGMSAELIAAASQAALVPIWFLAVYIVITVVVPLSYSIWEKAGLWSVLGLVLGAIAVDYIGLALDQGWLRWSNYGFVWLAVHQLGYWWRDSEHPKAWAMFFVVGGLAAMYVLLTQLGYPVSMVSVPGEEFSNTKPPTIAMLVMGAVQIGVVLLLEAPASRWLQNVKRWSLVIILNQMIMSVYLWHITAMIVVIGVAFGLGGIGLEMQPGTGIWWALRPVWVLLFVIALIPFILMFLRFEAGGRNGSASAPRPWQSVSGALVTCAGLVMMALKGIGADNLIGVNYLAVLMVVLGVGLATRRLSAKTA